MRQGKHPIPLSHLALKRNSAVTREFYEDFLHVTRFFLQAKSLERIAGFLGSGLGLNFFCAETFHENQFQGGEHMTRRDLLPLAEAVIVAFEMARSANDHDSCAEPLEKIADELAIDFLRATNIHAGIII